MSKPRIYGNPYRQLKAANLPKKQYQQIKGQIKAGHADDAMRGLMRLMENGAMEEHHDHLHPRRPCR